MFIDNMVLFLRAYNYHATVHARLSFICVTNCANIIQMMNNMNKDESISTICIIDGDEISLYVNTVGDDSVTVVLPLFVSLELLSFCHQV